MRATYKIQSLIFQIFFVVSIIYDTTQTTPLFQLRQLPFFCHLKVVFFFLNCEFCNQFLLKKWVIPVISVHLATLMYVSIPTHMSISEAIRFNNRITLPSDMTIDKSGLQAGSFQLSMLSTKITNRIIGVVTTNRMAIVAVLAPTYEPRQPFWYNI